jgi:hypothetical protein
MRIERQAHIKSIVTSVVAYLKPAASIARTTAVTPHIISHSISLPGLIGDRTPLKTAVA